MCELFDLVWKPLIALLLGLPILLLLFRTGGAGAWQGRRKPQAAERNRRWLARFHFWGRGFVALILLLLMIFGFWCAGSPGDIEGIVPN